MTSVLGLVEVTAAREVDAGFLRRLRTETYTFQDWTVDGTPLRELANVDEGDRHPTVLGSVGHVTYLVDGSDATLPSLDRFAGRAASDFPENRVALLVCAFDWDLACTTLSCRLELSPDRAVWRDLGWQSECEPDIHLLRPDVGAGVRAGAVRGCARRCPTPPQLEPRTVEEPSAKGNLGLKARSLVRRRRHSQSTVPFPRRLMAAARRPGP